MHHTAWWNKDGCPGQKLPQLPLEKEEVVLEVLPAETWWESWQHTENEEFKSAAEGLQVAFVFMHYSSTLAVLRAICFVKYIRYSV